MPDLLLELFSEEIPARMQRHAAADLKKAVSAQLIDAGLTYEAIREYWTPRRLTLNVCGLPTSSKDVREKRRGPSTTSPQKVVDGFLRSAGLKDISEAKIEHDAKKGDIYIAYITKKGRETEEILSEFLPDIIRNFPWPKSMRWGEESAQRGSLKWIRPLRNILCVFGPEVGETDVVPFTIGTLQSNNVTYGHRFLSDGNPIRIRRFSDYVSQLEEHNVILEADRRKNIILADAQNLCFARGLNLVYDEALIEEISGLVEWPVVLMGTFDETFLEIPSEIIRLTIQTHQKCFVTRKQSENGELSNHFILVSNLLTQDNGKEIVNGNSKVVHARLSDALYFWKTDQRPLPDIAHLTSSSEKLGLNVNKPLDQRMAQLASLNVIYHAKLGTQGEKVERVTALTQKIAPLIKADPLLTKRASVLAKADLQTEIVGEFPELQGVMGKLYALLQGEDPRVAEAIEDHYKPQGPTDRVPREPVAIVVALADKIDTLVGFWFINEKPTSSKDPYALRRAALGIIKLVLLHDGAINLVPLFRSALNFLLLQRREQTILQEKNMKSQNIISEETESIISDLLSFFHERLKIYLKEEGARHDIIEAVLAKDIDDFSLIARNIESLTAFVNTNDGSTLLLAIKRVINILENETKRGATIPNSVDPELFVEKEEERLYHAITQTEQTVDHTIKAFNFLPALNALVVLRDPIDQFFEKILVNNKNPVLRNNRLSLLERVRTITQNIADFSKLTL